MSDTTAITSLPSDPSVSSGQPVQQNIKMEINPASHHQQQQQYQPIPLQQGQQQQQQQQQQQPPQRQSQQQAQHQQVSFSPDTKMGDGNGMPNIVQQKTINSLVSGIQQAAAAGATALPSRDIPMSQNRIHMDNQVDSNYIPQQQQNDYIQNHDTEQQYLDDVRRNAIKKDNLDIIYDELQTPVLIALLFFLFNLPFFKKSLFEYGFFLFNKDGNYNVYGFAFTSVLFGLSYYILKSILSHFSAL